MHEIVMALGFVAGALYIASHYMKTMIPLRICEIGSNVLFVGYGIMYPSYPTFTLYGILIVINGLRLYEMVQALKKVRVAASGDLSMEWLKPFMHKKAYHKGDLLFRKGDEADEMFLIVSGACRVEALDLTLLPGQIVGELGFLNPEHSRTQTVECAENSDLLVITYDKVRELCLQDPTFGFYLLKLTSNRLLHNIHRMEGLLAARSQPATA
jgi:CRP/FNR family transcriptional regulator, cyclic AMP receptor protein